MNKTVTCKNCGWVHFEVTKAYVLEYTARWVKYVKSLTAKERSNFYGLTAKKFNAKSYEKECLSGYTKCRLCAGSHKNFKRAKKGDCPHGCTISPILAKGEDL